MDRSLVIYGVLFLVIPLILAAGALFVPSMAFGLTLALIAVLALGFFWAIALVDLRDA